jgi:hypothetical protein
MVQLRKNQALKNGKIWCCTFLIFVIFENNNLFVKNAIMAKVEYNKIKRQLTTRFAFYHKKTTFYHK